MNKLTEIKSLVQRHIDMTKALQQVRKDMADDTLSILREYGISQIGLWSSNWLKDAEFDRYPEYDEEDCVLFNDLTPDFDPALLYGGDENEFEGKIIALRDENGTLQFVCASDLYEDIRILDVMDNVEYPDEENIDFEGVMEALVKSIEFNIQNGIPVEKWGITHYPPVNPYADEYLSYEGAEEDDSCDDDFMED